MVVVVSTYPSSTEHSQSRPAPIERLAIEFESAFLVVWNIILAVLENSFPSGDPRTLMSQKKCHLAWSSWGRFREGGQHGRDRGRRMDGREGRCDEERCHGECVDVGSF